MQPTDASQKAISAALEVMDRHLSALNEQNLNLTVIYSPLKKLKKNFSALPQLILDLYTALHRR